jgi:hypothetical protein
MKLLNFVHECGITKNTKRVCVGKREKLFMKTRFERPEHPIIVRSMCSRCFLMHVEDCERKFSESLAVFKKLFCNTRIN